MPTRRAPDNERPFLSPKEVVAVLLAAGIEVTDDTVRNWCKVGLQNRKKPESRYRLGFVRIGGRIYVRRESLSTFIPLLSSGMASD